MHDGRKIPSTLENPIDNILIHVATRFNQGVLAPLHVHPNIVTLASIASGFGAIYFLYRSWFSMAGLLYAFAYFLDCVDGNLARMTNRETKLGDILDHIGDMLKISIMTVVYVLHKTISNMMKVVFAMGSIILFALTMVHLSCQEAHVADVHMTSPFLKIVPCIAPIQWTRWFGSGTFILFQTIMIVTSRVSWSYLFKIVT